MARRSEPPAPTAASLGRPLRAWYRRARRDLPWRADRDPYRVWISEAMLQQTRVDVVIDYYTRFLARFPDVAALAAADEADVLALWSGLGYYRRARALHAAARVVVERHAGRFPRAPAELLALPGVGRYTAGAVASIAFDLPEPLVDGNVARVLCRLYGIDRAPGAACERELWSRAAALVPARGAGEWNQALMELGATLCAPRRPACERCPLAHACVARANGDAERLPRPKPRPAPLDVALELLLVVRGGRVLLERRPDEGRMAGLWQLPTRELAPAGAAARLFPERFDPRLRAGAELFELRHSITRHRIRAVVQRGELAPGTRALAPLAWHARADLGRLALTAMARKAVARGAGDAGSRTIGVGHVVARGR